MSDGALRQNPQPGIGGTGGIARLFPTAVVVGRMGQVVCVGVLALLCVVEDFGRQPVPLAVFAQFYEVTTNRKEEEKFQILEDLCRKSAYIPTIITQTSEGGSFNMLDLIEYDTAVFFKGRL